MSPAVPLPYLSGERSPESALGLPHLYITYLPDSSTTGIASYTLRVLDVPLQALDGFRAFPSSPRSNPYSWMTDATRFYIPLPPGSPSAGNIPQFQPGHGPYRE